MNVCVLYATASEKFRPHGMMSGRLRVDSGGM